MIYAVIDTNVLVSALLTHNKQSSTIQVMEAMFANKIKEDTSLGSALFVLSCFRMTWELLLREFPPTIRRLATAPC